MDVSFLHIGWYSSITLRRLITNHTMFGNLTDSPAFYVSLSCWFFITHLFRSSLVSTGLPTGESDSVRLSGHNTATLPVTLARWRERVGSSEGLFIGVFIRESVHQNAFVRTLFVVGKLLERGISRLSDLLIGTFNRNSPNPAPVGALGGSRIAWAAIHVHEGFIKALKTLISFWFRAFVRR